MLYFGAEWFVAGASSLARTLRVPQLIIGLTVVAYGTSAPEIIVGTEAAAAGHSDVALGNVVGSNIANIGLILGLTALLRPARVDGALARRELPVLIASTVLVPLLLLDGVIRAWEAAGLLLVAAAYTGYMVRSARRAALGEAQAAARSTLDAADAAGGPRPKGVWRAAATAVVGLAILLVGGSLFIDGAVEVAKRIGMSERIVGLTIVAVGTSLPELITSLIAARRGHSDIAIGNVIGSNTFNVFLCLGAAALAGPVGAPLSAVTVELVALFVMTALAALFIRSERHVTRLEGALALMLYLAFALVTVLRG
ncbi:MAG: calcium/sodium antiporter [Deltaproteobacteria bacterium]|nr:calcium/sodium antiporter [Deltaproteobacteria bacterium]